MFLVACYSKIGIEQYFNDNSKRFLSMYCKKTAVIRFTDKKLFIIY